MANSFIQTPTDGSGKKLDTWTTTTLAQHRQAVVIGAKDTDANVAPVDATAGLKVDLGADNDVRVTDGTDTLLIDTNGSAQVIIKDGSGNTVTFNANGQAVAASSAPVVLASDASYAYSATAAITPGAAAHGAGDLVGTSTEIALAAPSGKRLIITSASLLIEDATALATTWRVHLYNVTQPGAQADNALWDLASGDRSSYLGYIDIPTATDTGATQYAEVNGINKQIKLSGTSVFAVLVCVSAVTTVAQPHNVTLHAILV